MSQERKARFQIAEAIADTADVSGKEHATYFCLQTKSHAHWEQSGLLESAMTRMGGFRRGKLRELDGHASRGASLVLGPEYRPQAARSSTTASGTRTTTLGWRTA